MIYAGIDIGNSRIKLFIDENFYSFEYKKNWISPIRRLFKKYSDKTVIATISSVNQKKKSLLFKALSHFENLETVEAGELINQCKRIDFSQTTGMGEDRKLGLIATLKYLKAPFFTIDCGTAVTTNFVDKNYICKGGVIFPGAYTQLKSLAINTYALKNVKANWDIEHIGKNSDDAISAGILFSIIGGVKEAVSNFSKTEKASNIKGIITGGYSKYIFPKLINNKIHIEYKKYLVLEGIMRLME
ncbi:MAG: type III pantothenate kinase [Ignavibacteria bacterium]|jgi:pantothenate kinase type III|nr:type III pantothenate kinase [Ignavibacteria bacterium]